MSKKVDKKLDVWKKKLLDMGMRNRLLNFKQSKRGSISIITPELTDFYKQLVIDEKELVFPRVEVKAQNVGTLIEDDEEEDKGSEKLVEIPGDFTTDRTARETTLIAKSLKDKAKTAHEEQGINILYAAFGFLEWKEAAHPNTTISSPLILVPVVISCESITDPYKLSLHEDEIVFNPTLAYKMENDFGLELPSFDSANDDISTFLKDINKKVSKSGWKVNQNVCLALLSFQRINMYKDIENRALIISNNSIVKALAGEGNVDLSEVDSIEGYNHDEDPVSDIFQVVDADSSQLDAIEMSKSGVSFVLQGPPGTGKSQTITNIIAEALANDKKVLFVSEKMAALEVVYNRLSNVGLSEFCLVLHSNKANKREFMDSLQTVIDLKPIAIKDSALYKLKKLEDRRARLNEYVEELHRKIQPLGQSAFEANGWLAKLASVPSINFSLSEINISKISKEELYDLRLTITELVKMKEKLTEDYEENTWRNSLITTLNHETRHQLSADLDTIIEKVSDYIDDTCDFEKENFISCDVSANNLDKFVDFINYCCSASVFPVEWIDRKNIKKLVNDATEAKQRKQRENELEEILTNSVNDSFFAVDASELKACVSDKIASAQMQLNEQYSNTDSLLDSIDSTIELLESANAGLNDEAELLDVISDDLQLSKLDSQSEIENVASFVKNYSYNIKPNNFWFESEWKDKETRDNCLNKAQHLVSDIISSRAAVTGRYEKDILTIDYKPILTRMRTDYTSSFLRMFKSSYKADMKMIRAYCKTPTKKLSYEELLDVLDKIKAHNETLEAMQENKTEFEKYLGGWFVGEATDFSKIKQAFIEFEKILKMYKGKVPDEIRQELLAGYNVDKYSSEAEKLVELSSNASIMEFVEMDRNVDLTSQIKNLIENLEELKASLVDCREKLNVVKNNSTVEFGWAGCYEKVCQMEELQALKKQDENYQSILKREFTYLYKDDETDWDIIIHLLNWFIKYREMADDMDINSQFSEVLATDEDAANRIKAFAEYLEKFKNEIQQTLNSFVSSFSEEEGLGNRSLSDILAKAKRCQNNFEGLEDWIDFKNASTKCKEAGLSDFIDKILNARIDAKLYEAVFMKKFQRTWLDYVMKDLPEVKSFRGKNHSDVIEEFKKLDEEQLVIARSRIREKLINNLPNVSSFTSSQDEVGILLHELGKQRKIMPVRKLFDSIPILLPRLKPCMMMSPLSVSQFIQSENYMFDMVIFDEASQVKTENAIGAISRGKQVIIAGDVHQLPPTNFFATSVFGSDEYEEDEDDSEAYESILDESNTVMPQLTLKWHYRSRNEELIAFSNSKIYNNSLITFPSPSENVSSEGVEYIYVENGLYQRSGKRNNPVEAKKVVDIIFEQITKYPERSLGVITFSEAQQRCVEAELIARRLANPMYEQFFAEGKKEAFFIKNLENVQGDERDTIVFSIGYGKSNPLEELRMHFGPLNQSGGYRRLNVAITRAKYAIKLVGSILPSDMRITDSTPRGVKLLRDYIEFAQQGAVTLRNQISRTDSVDTNSPFENAVYDFLVNNGFKVKTQVGCSGYRIDMAVVHPELEGRYVLGIECDGASYHSSRTARERDRLRQNVLENMGWKLYRIWSTDWIKDPITEGKHLLEAVQKAIREYKKNLYDYEKKASSKQNIKSKADYEKVVDVKESEQGYGFNTFVEKTYSKAVDEVPASVIASEIKNIVYEQAPVNIMTVCKQVAPLYGNANVTNKVKEGVNQIIKKSYRAGGYEIRGEFLWRKGQKQAEPRIPAEGNKPRPFDTIAIEELAEAMYVIIDRSFGIEKDSLFKVTAKEYGFARTTTNIVNGLEQAYKLLIKQKRISDIEGKLSVETNK